MLRIHIHKARIIRRAGIGAIKHSHQPHRHLPSLERLAGTDQPLATLDASQHAPRGQGFQRRLMHAPVVVAEVAVGFLIGNRALRRSTQQRPKNSQRHASPQHHATERKSSHRPQRCTAPASCCKTTPESWIPLPLGQREPRRSVSAYRCRCYPSPTLAMVTVWVSPSSATTVIV